VSLDSSGDNLHKRGIKKQGGAAPLRETLAAAILKMAGYVPGEPLADPMCGTGTFSLEAAMLNLNMPAGWFRDFAFARWPSFRPQRWHHLRRDGEKRFVTVDRPLIFASDISRNAVNGLSTAVRRCGFSGAVSVSQRDFFNFSPGELTRQVGVVVINPPYGLRLGSRHESRRMVSRICRHLQSAYRGWRLALIAPNRQALKELPGSFQSIPLVHGGLRLMLVTGKIV